MPQRFTWKKAEKLKSRKLIEQVFKQGKSFSLFPYRVYLLLLPADAPAPLQAGFGASSRNFKKAVDRNRIKRLSREAYRLQKQPLLDRLKEKGSSMAVFFIYTGKELPDYKIATEKIGVALQKIIKEIA
ncbi:MAG: ribonuclease P protein component [Bacteroidetes bacterium]|nr:ribonuclease P protein component [Bacteroidota bacterium]